MSDLDEIKVFKDEGEGEGDEEKRSSEINELKHSLIKPLLDSSYIVPPHANGSTSSSLSSRVPMVGGPHPGSPLQFMLHNPMEFPQPPPAHTGIHPLQFDPKTGMPRPPMYPLPPTGQYSHPVVFPDFAPQWQWHTPGMYPITSSAFRGPYAPSLSPTVSTSSFARFPVTPSLLSQYPLHHPGLIGSHHFLTASGKHHQDLAVAMAAAGVGMGGLGQSHLESGRLSLPSYGVASPHPHSHGQLNNSHSHGSHESKSSLSLSRISNGSSAGGIASPSATSANHSISSPGSDCKKSNGHGHGKSGHGGHNSLQNQQHVKKPLNAFMLYMKEMRTKVVAEYTLKESAAINQILGKKWHSLSREEQAKYYELARKERQLHMQLYPGWTARDNYAINQKKKKKKRDKSSDEGGSLKKCRARYGLDQQSNWCKPCRRKKKCIRYLDSAEHGNENDGDNLGSVGSVEAPTPDSKSANESDPDNMNLSSTELSLSSPPVPSDRDYIIPHHHPHPHQHHMSSNRMSHNHDLLSHNHANNNSNINRGHSHTSHSSSAASMALSNSCPPRNSPIGPNNPLSIEQLTRPHCPPLRNSLGSGHNSIITSNCSMISSASTPTTTASSSIESMPLLPTPPSTDSSSAAQMLTVA